MVGPNFKDMMLGIHCVNGLPASGHKGSASFARFNGFGGSGLAMDSSIGFSVDVEEVR